MRTGTGSRQSVQSIEPQTVRNLNTSVVSMRILPIVLCLLLIFIFPSDGQSQEIGFRSQCGGNLWRPKLARHPRSRPSRPLYVPSRSYIVDTRQEALATQIAEADVVVIAEFENTIHDPQSPYGTVAIFQSKQILKGLSKDSEMEITYPLTGPSTENIFGQSLIEPDSKIKTKWFLLLKKLSKNDSWRTLNSKDGWLPFNESNLASVQQAIRASLSAPNKPSVRHSISSECHMRIRLVGPMPAHLTKYFKVGSFRQDYTPQY